MSSPRFRMRFGDVAVAQGYVSRLEVDAALAVQRLDAQTGRPHRLIGQILVDRCCMTHRQVSAVLDSLIKYALEERTGRRVGPAAVA